MSYVVANWKMKMNLKEVEAWLGKFSSIFNKNSKVRVIIAPTSIHLDRVYRETSSLASLSLASQNVSANKKGSHTGELGAFQVKDYCEYCIVGHSERAEDPALVAEKRDIALENGLIPIVCFTSPDQAGFFYKKGALLAWEDPQNISKEGSYNEKPLDEIVKSVNTIRRVLPEEAGLLYGGSVNEKNVSGLVSISGLNGVLVGHASLDPEHFLNLINAYEIS
jgi:triosephosphate isomerase